MVCTVAFQKVSPLPNGTSEAVLADPLLNDGETEPLFICIDVSRTTRPG